ncbi:ribonuclease H-like domain-containing protein [Rhizophagus clarus]|uniref:Ribonuclease H-like domain-containing protein n=1 Tax=Rhizophagus clarus TaxID=94130 RepID=A0A8H3L1P6_9GLOM|nr:ribonuclease H-like domain-containing protein [Rhizophagus clarus]
MGTGWVILNNKDEVIVKCSSSIKDWPSSTRAELGAILSVMLVLQTGQIANIFTDSQATIDSINHTRTNLTNGKSKYLKIKLVKVKGHLGVKGNEEADKVAKNGTEKLTCITINDSQQKDLKYDLYWDGKRVDRNIRKFIDNLYESALNAVWSLNRTHKIIFQDTTQIIEEKVTWAVFKKIQNLIAQHHWLCLKENEDDDHIIYCQQLKNKWLMVANNTMCKSDQMIKDLLLQELPIPFAHLLLRNFFPKEKYKELKDIVKSEKATLTIATIFLEIFINEFYNIIWQPRCKIIAEWEYIKGIKKQDLKKKIPAYQHITYKRTLTLQAEDGIYDLKGRKIFKHNEQWSIALEKIKQYINQFIKKGNKRVVKAYTEAICFKNLI